MMAWSCASPTEKAGFAVGWGMAHAKGSAVACKRLPELS